MRKKISTHYTDGLSDEHIWKFCIISSTKNKLIGLYYTITRKFIIHMSNIKTNSNKRVYPLFNPIMLYSIARINDVWDGSLDKFKLRVSGPLFIGSGWLSRPSTAQHPIDSYRYISQTPFQYSVHFIYFSIDPWPLK